VTMMEFTTKQGQNLAFIHMWLKLHGAQCIPLSIIWTRAFKWTGA